MAKLHATRCPTCGANIVVPPRQGGMTCRYCRTWITVELRKPPQVQPVGVPSTTLYIDPDEVAKARRTVGMVVGFILFVSVGLPVLIGVGSWLVPKIYRGIRPFPATCGINETIELSGNWEGTGPAIAETGGNCKIKITKSKIKASTLVEEGGSSNLEITIEDSTIETTGPTFKAGNNLHATVRGGSIKSAAGVFVGESNLDITLENTTIESPTDRAIKSGYNLKLKATNAKIKGKKAALDVDANAKLTLHKGTEITSEAEAIKTTSGLTIEAEGGKIEGGEAAITASSGADITAQGTTFSSKDKALVFTSGAKLDLTGGAITSTGDGAIESSGGDFTFEGTKIEAKSTAIVGKNNLKLEAKKKASITSHEGDGLELEANAELTLDDASIDGARAGVKATVNTKAKLESGARIAGRNGGLVTGNNTEVEAASATIDGGRGPGIKGDHNARIQMQQGTLKGVPALALSGRPSAVSLQGTRVDGEQKTGRW